MLINGWEDIEKAALGAFAEAVIDFIADVDDEIIEPKWRMPAGSPGAKRGTWRKNQSDYPGLTKDPRDLVDTEEFRNSVSLDDSNPKSVNVTYRANHATIVIKRADIFLQPLEEFDEHVSARLDAVIGH